MKKGHSRTCGFSVLELLTAVSLLGMLVIGLVSTVKPVWADVDSAWQDNKSASLNLAMDTYRAFLNAGYVPQTPWSATDASGVLAELAKPLVKDGSSVTVMPTATQIDPSVSGVAPSSFTSSAVWSVAQ